MVLCLKAQMNTPETILFKPRLKNPAALWNMQRPKIAVSRLSQVLCGPFLCTQFGIIYGGPFVCVWKIFSDMTLYVSQWALFMRS